MIDFDTKMMNRCIQLAYNGLGSTYPNPMVGCVIVHQDKIIGEGWHRRAGEPHAEVNAIRSVKDKSLLPKSTLYVSLEPCSHFGKTPPCSDLIIKYKISKIVIGTTDPFAKVSGTGIAKLKEAGCEVIVGVLEKECQELNKRFFTFHQKKRPYIFLKWAETRDGFMAPETKDELVPKWITDLYSRQYVHKMRGEEQAILAGTNTILHDNPKLNVRDWFGGNLLRVVIDKDLKIPRNFSIWNDEQSTLFISEKTNNESFKKTSFNKIDFSANLPQQICNVLFEKNVQSLIVEGGRSVLQQFIEANLWDEAFVFVGNICFEKGLKSPDFQKKTLKEVRELDEDTLFIYSNL